MNLLVGDIGGTKTNLAVFSSQDGPHNPLTQKSYASQKYQTFDSMVREFLDEVKIDTDFACCGVAGPILGEHARVTNLPSWEIEAPALRATFHWSTVALLNDMEAIGYAIPILEKEDIYTLNTGKAVQGGCMAVLAPGTGLGEGFLTLENGAYTTHPSEGSHVDFGPVGSQQIRLLTFMNEQGYDHVSVERVCSGGLGIPNLYAFLKSTGLDEPAWLAEQLKKADDPTPVIVNAARNAARTGELARGVLNLFVAILGAEAGNLALKVLSTGGIYLGGGIPPKILAELEKPDFLEALFSKGRFRQLVKDMPVHVILNPNAGLLGAAAYGLRLAVA